MSITSHLPASALKSYRIIHPCSWQDSVSAICASCSSLQDSHDGQWWRWWVVSRFLVHVYRYIIDIRLWLFMTDLTCWNLPPFSWQLGGCSPETGILLHKLFTPKILHLRRIRCICDTKRLHHEESGESAPNFHVLWLSCCEWKPRTCNSDSVSKNKNAITCNEMQWNACNNADMQWTIVDMYPVHECFQCPVQSEDPLETLLSLQASYKSSGRHCSWHSLGEIVAPAVLFSKPCTSCLWKPYEKHRKRIRTPGKGWTQDDTSQVIAFELFPMSVSSKELSNRINSVWVVARPCCMSSRWRLEWRRITGGHFAKILKTNQSGLRLWDSKLLNEGLVLILAPSVTSYKFIEFMEVAKTVTCVAWWCDNVELFNAIQLFSISTASGLWGDHMAFCANSFLGVRSWELGRWPRLRRQRPAKSLFSESQFRRDHLWNGTQKQSRIPFKTLETGNRHRKTRWNYIEKPMEWGNVISSCWWPWLMIIFCTWHCKMTHIFVCDNVTFRFLQCTTCLDSQLHLPPTVVHSLGAKGVRDPSWENMTGSGSYKRFGKSITWVCISQYLGKTFFVFEILCVALYDLAFRWSWRPVSPWEPWPKLEPNTSMVPLHPREASAPKSHGLVRHCGWGERAKEQNNFHG